MGHLIFYKKKFWGRRKNFFDSHKPALCFFEKTNSFLFFEKKCFWGNLFSKKIKNFKKNLTNFLWAEKLWKFWKKTFFFKTKKMFVYLSQKFFFLPPKNFFGKKLSVRWTVRFQKTDTFTVDLKYTLLPQLSPNGTLFFLFFVVVVFVACLMERKKYWLIFLPHNSYSE